MVLHNKDAAGDDTTSNMRIYYMHGGSMGSMLASFDEVLILLCMMEIDVSLFPPQFIIELPKMTAYLGTNHSYTFHL